MNKFIPALLIFLSATAQAAPSPASGEFSEAGPLMFGGGPYFQPNPTSDVENTAGGDLTCMDPILPCDQFALTVNISDDFRTDEANKKEGAVFSLNFTAADPQLDANADFELYLFDTAGTMVAKSVSTAGIPESFRLPLSTLKNGDYVVTIVPYQPLGGSYTVDIQLDKDRRKSAVVESKGSSLLGGALSPWLLVLMLGFGLRRP